MKHPPYHLRPNKAVDRFMLIEALRCMGQPREISQYIYYGFGGPYLEDFRLMHENFPEMTLVSLERNLQTYRRQAFHLPCGRVRLLRDSFKSFLTRYDAGGRKSIFWLDYTDLEYGRFEDFMSLLPKVTSRSLIKLTLRCEPGDYHGDREAADFKLKFHAVLPGSHAVPPARLEPFAVLLQEMVQIAAQQALPSATGVTYQPIASFCYKDGVGMFTLTGIVCERNDQLRVRDLFSDLRFVNLNWSRPRRIDLPHLSTKERLHLQKHLPCRKNAGKKLLKTLTYQIDDNRSQAIGQMKQYADFYSYYPHFIRAIP